MKKIVQIGNRKISAKKKPILKRIKKDLSGHWQLYVMILLPVAWVLVFAYYPMYGAQIAFKDYVITEGITGSRWVGVKHFIRFLSNPQSFKYIFNTLAISLYVLFISFPIQIIFAVGLNYIRNTKIKKTVQMATYLPHFISVVIVVSMLNMLFNNRTGVFDAILEFITGKEIDVLGNPKYFRHLYVWSGMWQSLGWNSILYVSALAGVDPALHEAAMIDGASKWKRVWHIDIMSILPTVAITFILQVGRVLTVGFDKTFLMQNTTNINVSEILSTYEYKIGIGGMFPAYSYSSAIGLMSAVVTLTLVWATNRISKKMTNTGLW